MVLSQKKKKMIRSRHEPAGWDKPMKRRMMKTKTMFKVISIIMAALIALDVMLLFVIVVGAEGAVEVPEDVIRISEELGQQYGICPETIQAVAWVESRFDPEAENDGCTGIMQVSGKWHKDRMARLGVEDLKDTKGNMTVAVDYLSELVEDGEDMEIALMRYHGESRIMEKLSEGELSEYVDKVLAVSAMLEHKHGK